MNHHPKSGKITKNTEYKFTSLTKEDIPELARLLEETIGVQTRNKQTLLEWKYFHPFLEKRTISYSAKTSEGKIVSHYCNLLLKLQHNKTTIYATLCTDMATQKDHRGKGLISQLSKRVYEEVEKQGYLLSLGYSNKDGVKVDRNAKGYKYQIVGNFTVYLKLVINVSRHTHRLQEITNFLEKTINISPLTYSVEKSKEYLTWRYLKKPENTYKIYITQDHTFIILKFLGKICYVHDIIFQKEPTVKSFIEIMQSIEKEAVENNIRIVLYNVLENNLWRTVFHQAKYIKNHIFSTERYLTIRIHNHEKINSEEILNKENWYIMNGDIL
jgi:GNAT superfamily N-acetyltransferase